MQQNANQAPGLSLPPVPEQMPQPAVGEQAADSTVETGSAQSEMPAETARPNVAPLPAIPVPAMPVSQDDAVQASAAQDDSKASKGVKGIIEDKDLIDKEIVNKAKAIIERTREDPHQQSEELTVFKADYMQKNYNKALKLDS